MNNSEKPVASTGMRLLVALVGLLASSFALTGITMSINLGTNMLRYSGARLDISESSLYMINGAIMLLLLLLYPLSGFLGGKWGKAKFIAIGIVLVGSSVMVMHIASNLAVLVIAIVLTTIGMAMIYPCLLAYMIEIVTSRWFLAYAAAGYLASGMAANIVLRFLQPLLEDMNSIFIFALESPALGLLLGGGLMLVTWLIRRRYNWPDEWLDEPRRPHRGINLALLLLLFLPTVIASGALSQGLILFALDFGSLEETLGILQITWTVACLIGYGASGVLSDLFHWLSSCYLKRAFGRPAMLVLGLLAACVGLGLVFFTGKTLPSLQIALTVSGVGFSLALPPLLAHLIAQVRHQRRTVLLGGYLAIGFLGSVGSNIMAGFVGDTWGIRNLTLAIACVLLAAILLAIPILILSLVSNSEATG